MEIKYNLDAPENFSQAEIDIFLLLLKKQDQVSTPSMKKIYKCPKICIVYVDDVAIGIGALKKGAKSQFDLAGVKEIKDKFGLEIGYLFVDNESGENNYRGLGIGKTITNLLLRGVENQNVFATTEYNIGNPMLHTLKSLGFKSVGVPYIGKNTSKIITLMILNRNKTQ
jgi:hypothetical protein